MTFDVFFLSGFCSIIQLKHVLLRLRSDSTRRQPPLCYIDLPTFEHGAHNATGLRRDSTWSVYNPLELGVVEDPMVSFHHKTFRFEVLISTKNIPWPWSIYYVNSPVAIKKRPIHVSPRFFFRPKQKEVQNLDLPVFSVLKPRKTKKNSKGEKKTLNLHLHPGYCHCSCWFFLQQIQVPEVFFLFTTCPSLQVPALQILQVF